MYTSLIALVMVVAGETPVTPSWQTYAQASRLVATEQKPMAVFVGTGENGWEQVAGNLEGEAAKVLAANYVCVYANTDTPAGKALAQAFELNNGVGLVLSDRKGEKQVFWHDGTLPQRELLRQLTRFSSTSRLSMYPAESGSVPAGSIMEGVGAATQGAGVSGGSNCPTCSGSYCPSCSSGGRRRR